MGNVPSDLTFLRRLNRYVVYLLGAWVLELFVCLCHWSILHSCKGGNDECFPMERGMWHAEDEAWETRGP